MNFTKKVVFLSIFQYFSVKTVNKNSLKREVDYRIFKTAVGFLNAVTYNVDNIKSLLIAVLFKSLIYKLLIIYQSLWYDNLYYNI